MYTPVWYALWGRKAWLIRMAKKKETREVTLKKAWKNGDVYTKGSFLLMGLGNIRHGQAVKGVLFFISEIIFVLYMCMMAPGLLGGLVTLGTNTGKEVFNEQKQIYEYTAADNSLLFLFYGILAVFAILLFVILWVSSVRSGFRAQLLMQKGKKVPNFREDLKSLLNQNIHKLLLSGPIVCIFAFTVLPLIFMATMAFTNYDRNHQPPGKLFDWIGFGNFAKLFEGGSGLGNAFWHILGWTIVWAVFATFLNYLLGMLLAIVIEREGTRFKKFWRFIFVLSIAVPQFVSLLIMRTMLQPEGPINELLKQFGFIEESLPFWTNTTWARVTIIVVNLWIGIPFTMLQTTGVLQNIPKELYEAAKVDGANAVVRFFKITLPYMLFVTTPYLITQFIGNINNFNVIYLLTKGAPASMEYHNGTAGKTDLLVTWLYKLTIEFKDYNYGAVISIVVFVLSAVFALIAYNRTGALQNEEGFQ